MTQPPAATRYQAMPYQRCGRSGLQLPAIEAALGGLRQRTFSATELDRIDRILA